MHQERVEEMTYGVYEYMFGAGKNVLNDYTIDRYVGALPSGG